MKVSRMGFLRGGIAASAAIHISGCSHLAGESCGNRDTVRFGIVTDLHYADLPPDPKAHGFVGRRFYRESVRKIREAVRLFNGRGVDFAVELGDFKDNSGGREVTIRHLEAIEEEFARFNGPRYHVAGNHDFDCLAPHEFFSRTPNNGVVTQKGYYSFECKGVKFVVLNACFDSKMAPYSRNNPWDDSNVPQEEMAWFSNELSAACGKVVVFCHQRLDDSAEFRHIVKNASAIRSLMEKSGKVCAVLTGHQHCGGYHILNGIPYYNLRAMVCDSGEGENSYAVCSITTDGHFMVEGFCNAMSVKRTFCGESMKGCALRGCADEAGLRGATHLPFNFDDAQGGFD